MLTGWNWKEALSQVNTGSADGLINYLLLQLYIDCINLA